MGVWVASGLYCFGGMLKYVIIHSSALKVGKLIETVSLLRQKTIPSIFLSFLNKSLLVVDTAQ